MKLPRPFSNHTLLHLLHAINDGVEASYLLILPFLALDLQLSQTQVGTLGTMLVLFGALLAIPAGAISLKVGGLKSLFLSLVIYGLGLFGIGFSGNYVHLLFIFAWGGIGFGLFHPISFALVARRSERGSRGSAMGSFTAAGELGRFAISTILASSVVFLGWRNSAFIYGAGVLIIGAFLYRFTIRHESSLETKPLFQEHDSFGHVVRNGRFLMATAINMLDNVASQTIFLFLPFLLLYRGVEPALLGAFTGIFFVGSLFGRLYFGKLVDRFGSAWVFILSECVMVFFIIVLAQVTLFPYILGIAFLLGIVTKGTGPIVKTMVSESVEHQGNFEKAYGINSVGASIAAMCAPIALGMVSDAFGIVSSFYVMAFMGALAIIPGIGFMVLGRNFSSQTRT